MREDDTWLVLSAAKEVRGPAERPLRLHREMLAARPAPLGTVLVRSGDPLELLAVVHDLDQLPSCRPEWVAKALYAVLREARSRGLVSLALPLLGSVHGVLSPEQGAAILGTVLPRAGHGRLQRLWLQVPETAGPRVLTALLAAGGG